MTVFLSVAAWLAALLVSGPRAALVTCLAVVALLDLGALPARNAPEYDDQQAFYRTDQVISAVVAIPSGSAGSPGSDLAVTVLAQPVFGGQQAQFGLAGDVNGASAAWACPFQRGIQRLALPLPPPSLTRSGGQTADVRLHLTGSPARDGDYLVVYASSRLAGFDIALQPTASLDSTVTHCTAA